MALGLEVVATDNLSGGFVRNVPKGATWVQGDLSDPKFVEQLWRAGPFECVYHLAAYPAEVLSHFVRTHIYRTNLLASVNLLNAAVREKSVCFVFTSSIAVYGFCPGTPDEMQIPQPADPYGIAKYAFELDLCAARDMFGIDYVIFRPHNVYGPRQNIWDPCRNVVGIFIRQALEARPLTIMGDGLQTRAFSYVSDVAPIIARSPFEPRCRNQVFNIGSETSSTLLELADHVSRACRKPSRLEHLPARKEPRETRAHHGKIRAIFPAAGPVSLSEGVEQMVHWAQTMPAAHSQPPPPIEISRGLSWLPVNGAARAAHPM